MRLILSLLVIGLMVGSFQSCVSSKKYKELEASKQASDQALAETQVVVANLEKEKNELQATMEADKQRLNGEIESLRTDLNSTKSQVTQVQNELSMTQKELAEIKDQINGAFAKYKNSGLTLEEREGRLYVMTKQPVQYRTGSARLTSDEKKALDELAGILKNNPELKLLVEGHTDNVQFVPGAGSDNWDLSVRRAMSVVRQLLSQGVNPNQVAAVGRGETMPAASNDSSEGRAQNRRTVVMPDVDLSKVISGSNQ